MSPEEVTKDSANKLLKTLVVDLSFFIGVTRLNLIFGYFFNFRDLLNFILPYKVLRNSCNVSK